jgi:hypothetical protein
MRNIAFGISFTSITTSPRKNVYYIDSCIHKIDSAELRHQHDHSLYMICSLLFRCVLLWPDLFCYVLFYSTLFCSVMCCYVILCFDLCCSDLLCFDLLCFALLCPALLCSACSACSVLFFYLMLRSVTFCSVLFCSKNGYATSTSHVNHNYHENCKSDPIVSLN